MEIKIVSGKRKILIDGVEKVSEFGKFRGLMFRKKEKARALLFVFDKSTRMAIHSFFVFFPFVAIWLDDKNEIIEKKFIRPFRLFIKPKKPFHKLLEVPINKKYQRKILNLVDKRKI